MEWAIPLEDVSPHLGKEEIADRVKCYPAFGQAVRQSPINMSDVEGTGGECWALGERFDRIRFREFCSNPDSADVVVSLVAHLPSDDDEAAQHIDTFVENCRSLGYQDPKTDGFNASSAGLLASTLLTAAFPKRFVDFRQTRWKEFADELSYRLFETESPSYGEMIVAAGTFAQKICGTETFQQSWPAGEPLWTIAGICWHAHSESGADRPKDAPLFPYEEDFDEGALVLRKHLIQERNTSLIQQAKDMWREADPQLRCDVCQFSFAERYGELGEGYIEAHHTKPISTLKDGSRTRISDLAKVCANCHRMIHADGECREIEELRELLRSE